MGGSEVKKGGGGKPFSNVIYIYERVQDQITRRLGRVSVSVRVLGALWGPRLLCVVCGVWMGGAGGGLFRLPPPRAPSKSVRHSC